MRLKIVELADEGIVIKGRRVAALTVPYGEILTAERLRSRRGLDLHTRRQRTPVRARCRGSDQLWIEHQLRFMGVRVVDCWGAIIAPSLLDFEEELAREPVRVRQSSDNA